jgi:hypothetical protein
MYPRGRVENKSTVTVTVRDLPEEPMLGSYLMDRIRVTPSGTASRLTGDTVDTRSSVVASLLPSPRAMFLQDTLLK